MMECRGDFDYRENSVGLFNVFLFDRWLHEDICIAICVGDLVRNFGILNGGAVRLEKHTVGTFQLSRMKKLWGN